jgi:hypothetical protein
LFTVSVPVLPALLTERVGAVTVPVKAGLAIFALRLSAVVTKAVVAT